jgi:hypothetical protein
MHCLLEDKRLLERSIAQRSNFAFETTLGGTMTRLRADAIEGRDRRAHVGKADRANRARRSTCSVIRNGRSTAAAARVSPGNQGVLAVAAGPAGHAASTRMARDIDGNRRSWRAPSGDRIVDRNEAMTGNADPESRTDRWQSPTTDPVGYRIAQPRYSRISAAAVGDRFLCHWSARCSPANPASENLCRPRFAETLLMKICLPTNNDLASEGRQDLPISDRRNRG